MTSRAKQTRDPTRAEQALLDALPPAIRARTGAGPCGPTFVLGGEEVDVRWVGEGDLGDVRRVIDAPQRPDIVVCRRLSPGARNALAEAGISWVDETGAAEIALGTVIVSKSGHSALARATPPLWTSAVLTVAESVLCGTVATVSSMRQATGLSTGSCTNALRTLTGLGLLEADAARGRRAGRRVRDTRALLTAYAQAADTLRPEVSLQVGVTWRDPVSSLADTGRKWTNCGVGWCATGATAAAVLAPYLTALGTTEVYVQTDTMAGLAAAASQVDLRPIEGGRLSLRPMPTQGVRRLTTEAGGIRVAPWPRVYVDLRAVGVRGEEAAEHLWEVMRGRGA